jgi:hypothetical protein
MKNKTLKEVRFDVWSKNKNTPVVCLTTGQVFHSAREAERRTGIWGASILKACDGKTRLAGNKEWAYHN